MESNIQSDKGQFELLKEDYEKRLSYFKSIFKSRKNTWDELKVMLLFLLGVIIGGIFLSAGHDFIYGLKESFSLFGIAIIYKILLKPIWQRLIRNNKEI